MKKNFFAKRVWAIALCLIMMLGLLPSTVFADGTYTFKALTQSGNNYSTLRYYITDENAGVITVAKLIYRDGVSVSLVWNEGWYFEKWETYFNGYEDIPIFPDKQIQGSNPVNDDGVYTFYNKDDNTKPLVNTLSYFNIETETGYYGDHSATAVLKPIVTVNAGDGVTYVLKTNNPTTISENQTAVKYKEDVTITYQIDEKYTFISADATGTKSTDASTFGTVKLFATEKPTAVAIYTRLKQQTVRFDANGGSGTMPDQTFEHSVAQALTANRFTRTGYIFSGWSTEADGSGTTYEDKSSLTFTPATDGASITLYAQWAACVDHHWVDEKCELCETVCSHSGGNATCTEQATCGICGQKYGETAKHVDVNTDHSCDYNCGKTDMGEHIDENRDHSCDYGCFLLIGTHADSDDANHTCDYCGGTVDGEACADSDTNHACDECGASMGTHADGDDADHTCDYCGKLVDGEECVDADTDHACDECAAPMGTHEQAANKHTCDYCGGRMSECTGGTATCTQKALCEICGAEHGELLKHSYGEAWDADKDNHYHVCSCGKKADIAAHTEKVLNAKEATTTEKGYSGDTVCSVCGYEMAKGKDIPIKTNPATPDTDTPSSPQTGDTENITLWFTLMILSGIALISIFTRSKSRKANR